LLLSDHVENLKAEYDEKIRVQLIILYNLKNDKTVSEWELGLAEGQLLTNEVARRKLEMDPSTRDGMFEGTMERLIAARGLTD